MLLDGIILGFMYALIALGYTMVYGVLEFINFAHSEIFIFGAFVGVEILLVAAVGRLAGPDPVGRWCSSSSSWRRDGWPAACWPSPSSASPTGPCGRPRG